jgi:hypothetical protein
MFTIEYSKAVCKALKTMPRDLAGLIMEKLELLGMGPFARCPVECSYLISLRLTATE